MKACKTSGEGWGWAGSRCSKGEPGHRSHIVGSPRGGEGGLVPKGKCQVFFMLVGVSPVYDTCICTALLLLNPLSDGGRYQMT